MNAPYVEDVLGRFDGVRSKGGGGWTALCPAHEDRENSLSIDERDGRLLFKCFAGCDVQAITGAVGLELKHLYEPSRNGSHATVITVEQLARAKCLPVDALLRYGVKNLPNIGVLIPYRNEDGTEAPRHRLRTALIAKDGSKWTKGNEKPVPYGLPDLGDARKHEAIFITEGESDFWTLRHAKFPALGIPGAQMIGLLQPDHLRAIKRVYITQDTDTSGETFAATLSARVTGFGISQVFTVRMPEGVKDANDLYRRDPANFKAVFTELATTARSGGPDVHKPVVETALADDIEAEAAPRDPDAKSHHRESAANVAVRLALEANVELFHSPGHDGFITVPVAGHLETYPLRSRPASLFLRHLFFESTGKALTNNAVTDARQLLESIACFEGVQRSVGLRVARHGDNIYVDRGDPEWSAIEIGPGGWSVVPQSPVRFRRPQGFQALPIPQREGSISGLRRFVNVRTEDGFTLFVSTLIGAMKPPEDQGTYAVVELHGEEGTGKGVAQRIWRSLIDPVESPLRSAPRDERDLMIAARNGYVCSFDNMSVINEHLSDALCKLASGNGFATRQLYTDDEESVLTARRPIILNGINPVVRRGDLLSRTISISQPRITQRLTEREFWPDFEAERPRILGGLLDAVVTALARESAIKLDNLPRLADFVTWVTAAEPACPWPAGDFVRVFVQGQADSIEAAFDGDPLVDTIKDLPPLWDGTCGELLDKLKNSASDAAQRVPTFPKTAQQISKLLVRLAPPLSKIGIEIYLPEGSRRRPGSRKKERLCRIVRDVSAGDAASATGDAANQPSVPVKPADSRPIFANGDGGDAGDAAAPTTHTVTEDPDVAEF